MDEERRKRIRELKIRQFVKADPATRDKILRQAVQERDTELLSGLWLAGVQESERSQLTPALIEAALQPFNESMADFLAQRGFNFPAQLVMQAVEETGIYGLLYFLKQKPELGAQAILSPLIVATTPEKLELLLRLGVDPNVRDEQGATPLMILAYYWESIPEHRQCLKLLLKHGADVNAHDDAGKTAFDYGVLNSGFKRNLQRYTKPASK